MDGSISASIRIRFKIKGAATATSGPGNAGRPPLPPKVPPSAPAIAAGTTGMMGKRKTAGPPVPKSASRTGKAQRA